MQVSSESRQRRLAHQGPHMELHKDVKEHQTVFGQKETTTKKAGSTRVSRAVPHLSTHRALSHLTSEFGRDPVHLA